MFAFGSGDLPQQRRLLKRWMPRWPTCASSNRSTVNLSKRWRADHDLLVTVEENVVMGGAGSAVAEVLTERGIHKPMLHLGLPDRFVEHGDPGRIAGSLRSRCRTGFCPA
jgi:hypothetical protein